MHWSEKVREAAAELTIPDLQVSESAVELVTEAVGRIDERYGPDSDNYLPYHNAEHTIDVTKRSMRVLSLLCPHIADLEKWGKDIVDISFVSAGGHDLRQDLGRGENEQASGLETAELIDKKTVETESPPWQNPERFKERVGAIIMATEVEVKYNGEFFQTNLTVGEHDPAKFVLAFADINGIAMEGVARMIRDSLNLYVELNRPDITPQGVATFLCTQQRFLRDRLYKNRVQSDLAYYFPDEAMMDTYAVLRNEFLDNITTASTLAKFIQENPTAFEAMALGLLNMAPLVP